MTENTDQPRLPVPPPGWSGANPSYYSPEPQYGTSIGDSASPEPEDPDYDPTNADGPSLFKRLAGPLIAAALLIANFAAKAKGLLLLLPKLKVFTTSASMLVSVAAYQFIFGWPFAVGFVLLILIHEMGHVFQLRREGIEASAPMFIPFLGAAIAAKSMGDDAAAEARVGLAGPIMGTLASLVPLGIWLATGEEFWQALAFVGFFLNLFNLLPVLPLDGGRAMAALSPWMWGVGYAGLIAATIFFPNPIMLLILLFGGMETYRRWQARHTPESKAFYDIPTRTRLAVAVVYIGLAIALGIGMAETHLERSFSDV